MRERGGEEANANCEVRHSAVGIVILSRLSLSRLSCGSWKSERRREGKERKPELGLSSPSFPAFSEMEASVSHPLTSCQGEIDPQVTIQIPVLYPPHDKLVDKYVS